MIENLLIILSFNFIVITILWLSSLKTRRADFIDIYWGPSFFFSTAIIYFLDNDYSLPKIIALSLVGLWGLRLGIYLFSRNIRKSEDGLKVGGHQASSASIVSIMVALYFKVLQSEDRVAVKPHAAPVFHSIQSLCILA